MHIQSGRVGSFPRAEEELIPPRVVARGKVKDERHQGEDVLYSNRLGVGVGIEVGQGGGLMEERIMKRKGSVCTDSSSDST